METFAETVLRDKSDPAGPGPAQAFGNEHKVSSVKLPNGSFWASVDVNNDSIYWKEDPNDPHTQSLEEFFEFDGWHTYNGGL